jgi:DNA-directed RNA polymerase specialized sigma24 family protein
MKKDIPTYTYPSEKKETFSFSLLNEYEPLLFKIGVAFGFNGEQTNDLIKLVSLASHQARMGNVSSFRIWLCKIMVHKCVISISAEIFNNHHYNTAATEHSFVTYTSGYERTHARELKTMPLSFRTVYILNKKIEFNDTEIAEILNLTPLEVRIRLIRAHSLLNAALKG